MAIEHLAPPAPADPATASASWHDAAVLPGLLVCVAIAAVATVGGIVVPVVGAPVIGILAGVLWRCSRGLRASLVPGVEAAKNVVLQLSVVVLGSQLSLAEIAGVGVSSLPVMLGTLVVVLGVCFLLGRALSIDGDLRTLIGVGTAICGASAIAAVSPVLKARSNHVAYAVSTIFVFNIAAVLVFPPLGHALGMSPDDFGLFAGTAVNDTSSVVATASVFGHGAVDHAVVVKLVRTLMIIPICLGLAAIVRRREARNGSGGADHAVDPVRLVPRFLVGFVLVAALNSLGAVPASSHPALAHVSLFLITVALAGIGLSTDVAGLRRTGARPLLLGLLLWITVAGTSLLLRCVTV